MTGPPPTPLHRLWPEARPVWRRVHRRAVERGLWRPEYRAGLEVFSQTVGLYVRLREDLRRLLPGVEAEAGLREHAEELRRLCRAMMVDWGLIPPARDAFGPVDANGDDEEIRRLAMPGGREACRVALWGGDAA